MGREDTSSALFIRSTALWGNNSRYDTTATIVGVENDDGSIIHIIRRFSSFSFSLLLLFTNYKELFIGFWYLFHSIN